MRPDSGRAGVLVLTVSTLLFYLALSGSLAPFEVGTGLLSAIVVGMLFADITFETEPDIPVTITSLARFPFFAIFLAWEVIRANLALTVVILHPDLPIDPSFEEYETPDASRTELVTLATSISLTPGTLVVDADGASFETHVLTPQAWDDLLNGSLERAVGFVFAGRPALAEPGPRKRLADEREGRGDVQ